MTDTPDTFLLRHGQTLVFIGDSITDCGRRDHAFPFGGGYIRFAIDLITARHPGRISSTTTRESAATQAWVF